jgi:hypothetical protein
LGALVGRSLFSCGRYPILVAPDANAAVLVGGKSFSAATAPIFAP